MRAIVTRCGAGSLPAPTRMVLAISHALGRSGVIDLVSDELPDACAVHAEHL